MLNPITLRTFAVPGEEPPGHERAEHGPGVIESALQAEGPTPER